jgi:hypothetical protein
MMGLSPIYLSRISDAKRILDDITISVEVDDVFIDAVRRVEKLMQEIREKAGDKIDSRQILSSMDINQSW